MDQTSEPLHVTLNFDADGLSYARLEFTKHFDQILNPEQYFLAPAAQYNEKTKRFDIIEYSFVHVSNLPSKEKLFEMMYNASGNDKYKEI